MTNGLTLVGATLSRPLFTDLCACLNSFHGEIETSYFGFELTDRASVTSALCSRAQNNKQVGVIPGSFQYTLTNFDFCLFVYFHGSYAFCPIHIRISMLDVVPRMCKPTFLPNSHSDFERECGPQNSKDKFVFPPPNQVNLKGLVNGSGLNRNT